jgi:DNA-binding transcriptional regulator of glucitol operon
VRNRWLSRRSFVLHFLLVTIVPGCLLAGWWQVHRALSGNLLSYFYSVEWPIFAILGVVAWWQLIHDVGLETAFDDPRRERRSFLHRDDEVPSQPLVWDQALESPELRTYNQYLRALADRGARKTWGNPRGLPPESLEPPDNLEPAANLDGPAVQEAAGAGWWGRALRGGRGHEVPAGAEPGGGTDRTDTAS